MQKCDASRPQSPDAWMIFSHLFDPGADLADRSTLVCSGGSGSSTHLFELRVLKVLSVGQGAWEREESVSTVTRLLRAFHCARVFLLYGLVVPADAINVETSPHTL